VLIGLGPPPMRAIYWLGDNTWRDLLLTETQLDEPSA